MLCGSGWADNAEVLPIRWHGKYCLTHGIYGFSVACAPLADYQGATGARRRLPHRVPRSNRDQGQRQHAHLLATWQKGLRQTAPTATAHRVSYMLLLYKMSHYNWRVKLIFIGIMVRHYTIVHSIMLCPCSRHQVAKCWTKNTLIKFKTFMKSVHMFISEKCLNVFVTWTVSVRM